MDKETIDRIVIKLAKEKARPATLFEGVFFDMKQDIKKYSDMKAKQAVISLQTTLKEGFSGQGYDCEVSLKLGKFRGHSFITSAILMIANKLNDKMINKILEYLIANYSPKYKYKGIEDGKHKFNVR